MMITTKKIFIVLTFFYLLINTNLYGQGRPYEGPDDPASDLAAIREGFMTGNRVLLRFESTGFMGGWPNNGLSKWPNDYTGTGGIGELQLLVGARIFLKDNTVPVDNFDDIENTPGLDTLHYVESYSGYGVDKNESGTVVWGLYPVFGYFNETSEYVAMSNRADSWPPLGWPSRGDEVKWPGEWDGRFGRGVKYADLESYYVSNDAHDQEYLGSDDVIKYYPRPGVYIGDKRPDVTIQKDFPWGGIGIRIKVRGYQWNNIEARDAIFWEYDVTNISEYNITQSAFGYRLGSGIGNFGSVYGGADIGFYDKSLNMAYVWDVDGIGSGGLVPGVLGIAFLESPGIPFDGSDNDNDGLIDEKRDNPATTIIGPTDGINDLDKFLAFYDLEIDDLREHWDADEDQDWVDGDDLNGNGIYDNGENPGDDVGLDGVGPGELNYFGPDEGECNHKPDFLEGYGSEPNFAMTDVSESDMIGLTSCHFIPGGEFDQESVSARHDKQCWNCFAEPGLEEYTGIPANLFQLFGSGIFPLYKGRTERISVSELHAYENLSGLMSPDHLAPSLFQKKKIAQYIYESDYRFASPPKMPTLSATAGDGKVILTWDNVAEKYTREPMIGNKNDFEGYKLYKATDKYFSDAEVLVDMYGNPTGKRPIFQCDLNNGITGAADFAVINGEAFYLGDDSGIQHFFVDEDVQNGRTYYYGIVAYDYGINGVEVQITPSENNLVIELDDQENVREIGKNIQIVTPHQQAAGYTAPSIKIEDVTSITGNGGLVPDLQLLDIHSVKGNHTYKVKFLVDTLEYLSPSKRFRAAQELHYINNGFAVYDVTNNDSLVYMENPESFSGDNLMFSNAEQSWYMEKATSDPIDGIQININSLITPELDADKSGWVIGDAPILVTPLKTAPEGKTDIYYFPWNYEIVFTGEDSAYGGLTNDTKAIKNPEGVLIGSDALLGQKFNFYVLNKSFKDTNDQYLKLDLVGYDEDQDGVLDLANDMILAGHTFTFGSKIYWGGTIFAIDFKDAAASNQMPEAEDVYQLNFKRPYGEQDSLVFTVIPEIEVEQAKLDSDMDDIKVVPNPYIATNAMESAVSNPYLNQPRQLIFTHIPARCTIKIFTSSGIFIDEIAVQDNAPENGIVHWDMLTREGLEIAAGIYIYYIKSDETGKEKLGKFAVIK